MTACAGVVLAGGRSSRMGVPKAALEWHGSTLLRRTVGILARATGGPVVVVRASGQDLPELPESTVVVDDPRDGKGPVQGIAAGLAALDGRADAAFISATDMPFLHPAFIRRVLRALEEREETDVALPVARGYPQPLAAAYRVRLAPRAERLVQEDRLRPAFLFDQCTVERLDDGALKADALLAALDPDLDSVLNVNTQADYQEARARPAPEVTVRLFGGLARADRDRGPRAVRAATVDEAAVATGLTFGRRVTAALNGDQVTGDGSTPLAAGDTVFFLSADANLGLPGRAPVAAQPHPQLGDAGGPRGGHDKGPGDGGQQQRDGQGYPPVSAEEGDGDGVRVLDDEDEHHDEDEGARDQRGTRGADPAPHRSAAGRRCRRGLGSGSGSGFGSGRRGDAVGGGRRQGGGVRGWLGHGSSSRKRETGSREPSHPLLTQAPGRYRPGHSFLSPSSEPTSESEN
jgi:molybdopterin-guanine dinucleotide biosynthesis protein A